MTDLPELISDLLRRLGTGDLAGIRSRLAAGELDALKPVLSREDGAALPGKLDAGDTAWLRRVFGAAGAGVAAGAGAAAGMVGNAGRGGLAWLKWAIPAVIVLALVAFGITRCGSGSSGTAAATSSSATSSTESASATESTDTAAVAASSSSSAPATSESPATDTATPTPTATPAAAAAEDFVVYFDTDSAAIRPDAAQVIAGAAAKIKPGSAVVLTGFADQRGNAQGNLDLSKRRAAAVADALKKAGVNATFTIQARGVAAGGDLQKSRRVEIHVA
jgi:outer membrane protein OmpA-like peptidoglycan-associated protein